MLPALLITFREVIEASLIVATILGILAKLKQVKSTKTVWLATGAAAIASILLLGLGSLLGLSIQELYEDSEQLLEGIFMITSAVFITWAVFFLHNYFAQYKTRLLQQIKTTIEQPQQKGLFILVFTAVFREGFEIVLFLSTIYFSDNPGNIFTGFSIGAVLAFVVAVGLFTATLKLPLYYAFRTTSALLILFASGLLARGIHEFAEAGILAETPTIALPLIPHTNYLADMLKAVFGITKTMDVMQLYFYIAYAGLMFWWVFLRKQAALKKTQH